ncbi:MAG: Do family serine endopeptidase [Calditrichaceae bacterium]|nr:Do family serine endopeptidase [Calditrichaceae bacterium]
MPRLKYSLAFVTALITIGIVIGMVLIANFDMDNKSIAGDKTAKIYTEAETNWDSDGDENKATDTNFNPNVMFVDIVKKVRPSIVSIYTTKSVSVEQNPFYFFFRQMPQDGEQPREQRQDGLGSGIIISEDGYILTNYHVIKDVDELKVMMIDNREYEAKVIGSDPATEIALIKIEADDLPVAVLGNSDNVEIGEWVMAIGSPLYLTSTVTAGIVSALSRNINIIQDRETGGIENFIQTDAAINPGNSGGALLNLKGQVIGVNTAIATRTNYYMGYGFAVPINIAKSVVEDLMSFGEVKRGYLGVYIESVDPIKAKGVKLDKPKGVMIINVIKGSAADEAGLKEGDVILSVNGYEVNQTNELQAKVGIYNPGDKVKLEVWRYGKKMDVTATLQSREGETSVVAKDKTEEKEKNLKNLGLKVSNLNQKQLSDLDLESGIVVLSIEPYSPANRARISKGDAIYEVNGDTIESVSDFYEKVGKFKSGEVIQLKVRRLQDNEIFDRLIFLEIPE